MDLGNASGVLPFLGSVRTRAKEGPQARSNRREVAQRVAKRPSAISGAAPEKRKRGRPRIMPASYSTFLAEWYPDIRTERGRQDIAYRLRALDVLADDERFSWLADSEAMEAGSPNAWKPSILSELGRFGNDETLRSFALALCEIRPRPKTKEAVSMLRRARRSM